MDTQNELTTEQQTELNRIILRGEIGLPNANTGPFPKTKTHAKHQPMCNDCGTYAAQISWKDDIRNSDTWFYAECAVCENAFCEDCIDVTQDPVLCHTCQDAADRNA